MSQHAHAVDQRFGDLIAGLVRRIVRLEQRTQCFDTGVLLGQVIGTIPGTYVSGQPTVVLAGQTAPIGPFPCLTSYTPHANDTVLLIPLGQSYVIAGTYA